MDAATTKKQWLALAISLIWVGVFVAVFIVVWLTDDGDPLTDADEATAEGAGYVAATVGFLLTGICLVVLRSKEPLMPLRTCPSCGVKMQADLRVCASCAGESQPWIRHQN